MLERIYLHLSVCISINLTLNFMCGYFTQHFVRAEGKVEEGNVQSLCVCTYALFPLCMFPSQGCPSFYQSRGSLFKLQDWQ